MTDQEQTTVPAEQPQVATPADSTGGPSLQDGGITPQVEAALAGLPPEAATIIREDISQRNAHLTQRSQKLEVQRQALEQDTQLAGMFREAMQDSNFAEFLEARQAGDMEKYFLRKAGQSAGNQGDPASASNQVVSVSPDANGLNPSDTPAAVDHLELARRIATMETHNANAERNRMMEEFASNHPDYEDYLPIMHSVRQRLPGAGLEDLFMVARQMVSDGIAQKASDANQVPNGTEGVAPASPPLPLGAPPGSSTPDPSAATTMAEAMAQAKEELGITPGQTFAVNFES